jgi:uncharacterized protein YjiS (DUF1127 family)
MARDPVTQWTASACLRERSGVGESPAKASPLDLHIIRLVSVWIERERQRRRLAGLSDRSLKDIGISRYDALHEARKPFWRE